MSVFSEKELDYLADQRLGRLATIDANGLPHVVPLGWSYNPALDTIDVGGLDFARTKKFRNVLANSKVALVIDDVLPPWRPRCVMVRGQAEALEEATSADGEQLGPIIRIHPGQVISWGLDGAETYECQGGLCANAHRTSGVLTLRSALSVQLGVVGRPRCDLDRCG